MKSYDPEEAEREDQAIARQSPLWSKAVAFLRDDLAGILPDIRKVIATPGNEEYGWCAPYHFNWGMAVRNTLREHGFGEQAFGVQNLDNIYVVLVEEAAKETTLIPFDEREVDATPGCFMLSTPPMDLRVAMLEHYPMHWVMHMIHAMQTIGIRMPDRTKADMWFRLYLQSVKSLHLNPELPGQFDSRLSEDRIANNSVVAL